MEMKEAASTGVAELSTEAACESGAQETIEELAADAIYSAACFSEDAQAEMSTLIEQMDFIGALDEHMNVLKSIREKVSRTLEEVCQSVAAAVVIFAITCLGGASTIGHHTGKHIVVIQQPQPHKGTKARAEA